MSQWGPGLDLRLVPAAVCGWVGVLAVLRFGTGAAVALVLVAGVGSVAGMRSSRGSVLLQCSGVTLALLVVAGAHVWSVSQHPAREAAQRGAFAEAEVTIRDDPRALRSPGFGRPDGAVAEGEFRSLRLGDRRWQTGGRVVLLGPAEGLLGLLPGQRVRVLGLLAPAFSADLTVALLRVRGDVDVVTGPSRVQRYAGELRGGLRDASTVLGPEAAGLLPALVVGDTSAMVPTVRDDFKAAGLAHLTAVSGANVAIVCGAVLGAARLARAGPRTSAVLAALALVGFVVLARPSPSVLRAAVMGGITLLALVIGRGRSAVPALCAAVLALLCYDPALGADPGFALSVLATGGLVLLAPPLAHGLRARQVPPGVAEALAVPTAAFVVTAPVIAGFSGQISLVSIPANLLAVPAVAPATVLGVVAAALTPVHDGSAELLVRVAGPPIGWLLMVGHRAAAVPDGVQRWPGGAAGGVLLAVLLVAALLFLRAPRIRALAAAILLGLLLVLVPTRFVTPGWPPPGWVMVACDVGQGDGLVLATGEPGRVVLVDVGPDGAAVSACLHRLKVRSVALVVLTHLHADHIGGLAAVLADHPVGAVALGPGRSPPSALRAVTRAAHGAGVATVALGVGTRLGWPHLRIDVLGPRSAASPVSEDPDGTDVNDTSVVLRAVTPVGRLLLTGDVELAAQSALLHSGVDLRAQVLKVPHHGSRYSVPEFLAAARPRVAVVSVGADNTYGHPNAQVLGALERLGARVVRTDEDGDIAIVRDESGLAVVTSR